MLGLGTAGIAGVFRQVDKREAAASLNKALEVGIRYFDTAPVYGYGEAERRLGRAIAGRDRIVVSTKVGRVLDEDDPRPVAGSSADGFRYDYSMDGVRASIEGSLRRLRRDRVDVCFLHVPAHQTEPALQSGVESIERLRAEGLARYVGVAMDDVAPLRRFLVGWRPDVLLVAGRYGLLDHSAFPGLLARCDALGIPVVAAGIFHSGVLGDPDSHALFQYAPASLRIRGRAREARSICARYGTPVEAVAIQFALAHPVITTALLGTADGQTVSRLWEMPRFPIPRDLWAELAAARFIPRQAFLPCSEVSMRALP